MSSVRSQASGSTRMRIRNFPAAMEDKYFSKVWAMLKKAIEDIQRKNSSGLSFEELYRSAYRMVLHKYGEKLYSGVKQVIEDHLRNEVRIKIMEALDSGNFLEVMNEAWNDHTMAMVMIRDILMYMDRVYVEQNKVEPVFHLGLAIFSRLKLCFTPVVRLYFYHAYSSLEARKAYHRVEDLSNEQVFYHDSIHLHLRTALLTLIQQERHGVVVNRTGIKSACQMLVALGVHSHDVYVEEFENVFLMDTAEYYRGLSTSFLASNSANLYVEKAEKCLRDESERAKRYLDPQTEAKVLDVLENVLIKEHMHTIVNMEHSGVHVMLSHDKYDQLAALYGLLQRVEGGLSVMAEAMCRYLRQTGAATVKEDCERTPVRFVEDLLELKERFDKFLWVSFKCDNMFENRIQNEFETFINLNKNSPEYLSLYMDEKLRKGLKSDNDENAERQLNRAMGLFRFLQEKDVFEKYYKQHMAKRLLLDKSISDDMERMMISRLKTECGCHFTLKLENMFRDRELWPIQANAFKDFQASSFKVFNELNDSILRTLSAVDPIDLEVMRLSSRLTETVDISVRVLTTGIWPTQNVPVCIIPPACESAFNMFNRFYQNEHHGRKLTLNTMLGTADVKAIFYTPVSVQEAQSTEVTEARKEESKILVVNTHQMVILMCFNKQAHITFGELMDQTNIAERELKRNLQSLAMGKPTQRVLSRKGKGKDIDASDEFYVNDNFQSKLTRIKIQMVAFKGESEAEKNETRTKVEDDRKHEIDAAIVRVMKSRKVLDHNNLITEVTEQVKHRFLPNPILIKKRIESLIERDYLARDTSDLKLYNYVA
ncbi:hypothetical protein KIN20_014688 [Parelaphostrongylus tenuis]|uniref:Cullin family profile domain-containing protein n=1 Tax=Parelaphostrongylus tenuis TaxID=148309 RepID=A0AAD5MZH3_PARTN|nr:hypothetical protein KIN20_014688 [Parelaphostrongylus tenuis]